MAWIGVHCVSVDRVMRIVVPDGKASAEGYVRGTVYFASEGGGVAELYFYAETERKLLNRAVKFQLECEGTPAPGRVDRATAVGS